MFKITAIYNNETFNANLPENNNVFLLLNKKNKNEDTENKSNDNKNTEGNVNKKEMQVPISELDSYYIERFLVMYKGYKTGIIKFLTNKNIIILGITDIEVANELRFYKSDGKQWCKNINFSDVEKLIIEKYDFLTKEKTFTEYTDNIENLLKLRLSVSKKEEDSNEPKEEEK